ncbi:hypothetical protein QUB47_12520 [Microcoleus sp. AT9_B5]
MFFQKGRSHRSHTTAGFQFNRTLGAETEGDRTFTELIEGYYI